MPESSSTGAVPIPGAPSPGGPYAVPTWTSGLGWTVPLGHRLPPGWTSPRTGSVPASGSHGQSAGLRPGVLASHGGHISAGSGPSARHHTAHQHAHSPVASTTASPTLLTPHDATSSQPAHAIPLDEHVSGALVGGTDDTAPSGLHPIAAAPGELSWSSVPTSYDLEDLVRGGLTPTTFSTGPVGDALDATVPLPPPDTATSHGLSTNLTDEFGLTTPHPLDDHDHVLVGHAA